MSCLLLYCHLDIVLLFSALFIYLLIWLFITHESHKDVIHVKTAPAIGIAKPAVSTVTVVGHVIIIYILLENYLSPDNFRVLWLFFYQPHFIIGPLEVVGRVICIHFYKLYT